MVLPAGARRSPAAAVRVSLHRPWVPPRVRLQGWVRSGPQGTLARLFQWHFPDDRDLGPPRHMGRAEVRLHTAWPALLRPHWVLPSQSGSSTLEPQVCRRNWIYALPLLRGQMSVATPESPPGSAGRELEDGAD